MKTKINELLFWKEQLKQINQNRREILNNIEEEQFRESRLNLILLELQELRINFFITQEEERKHNSSKFMNWYISIWFFLKLFLFFIPFSILFEFITYFELKYTIKGGTFSSNNYGIMDSRENNILLFELVTDFWLVLLISYSFICFFLIIYDLIWYLMQYLLGNIRINKDLKNRKKQIIQEINKKINEYNEY